MPLALFCHCLEQAKCSLRRSTVRIKRSCVGSVALLCAISLAITTGCASYKPQPLVPSEELERLRSVRLDSIRIEYVKSGHNAESLSFNPLDGLDEAELASIALTINPALKAKRLAIGEARAMLVSAGLLPNPDIGAFVRRGIGGATTTAFGFDALFGVLRPDERPAKRAVAKAQIEIARAKIVTEELRLVSQIRHSRIAVLSAEQEVRLLEQELTIRDSAVTLVKQQRELGEATEMVLVLAELDRTSVQRQVRDAHSTAERERRALNALLGIQPTIDVKLLGSGSDLVFTIVDDLSDDAIDNRLLSSRIELREREANYQLAEQELRLAIAKQFPRLGFGPSYEKENDGSEGLGLGASFEIPFFDRNQGDIEAKFATRDRKRAEYVSTLHELRAKAFDARARLRRARTVIELLQSDVLPLVQRGETLFESALRARELSIFEWMTVRSRAIQARRDLLNALALYADAAVDLDEATGVPFVTVLTETTGTETTADTISR